MNKLRVEKESLEIKVGLLHLKNLVPNFNFFSSGLKKLTNILGLNKLASIKGGLGFKGTSYHIAIPSKNRFVPISDKIKSVGVRVPRLSMQHKFPQPKAQSLKPRIAHRFIPTCHNFCVLGCIRPRYRKFFIKNNKQDLTTYVRFLTN